MHFTARLHRRKSRQFFPTLFLDWFMDRFYWSRVTCQGRISDLTNRGVDRRRSTVSGHFIKQGVHWGWGKGTDDPCVWMYSPKTQPTQVSPTKLPFCVGTPNPPSSSCKQMHVPPQLLALLCFPGNYNMVSAWPIMLRYNVACNSWSTLHYPNR